MDPLSVAASIVGILAAAGKISELLHCVVSSAKDAPRVVNALVSEVDDVRAAVSSLQGLLMHHLISAPARRTKLIQLDRLIVTLTEMVLTFSDLEATVSPMVVPEGEKTPLKTRLRWTRIEGECSKMVEKLQRHKASVSLLLNILQCESDAEAARSQAHLEALVETLLLSNQELCQRMRAFEGSLDARSIYTKKTKTNTLSLIPQEDNETIIPLTPRLPNNYITELESMRVRSPFEDDLEASRVYTRVALYDFCDRSFVSSAIRTNTWSVLSLSDISVISVLALPLFQGDISNQEHYSFGDIDSAQVLGAAALRTIGQSLAQSELPPLIESSLEGAGERDDTVPTQSAKPTVSSTPHDTENATPLPKDDWRDEWIEKKVYLCKGCGKLGDDNNDLLMFKGNKWHVYCFVNSRSDSSECAHIGPAILSNGLRFCTRCMRCRVCARSINAEKESYVQIEQLVYCMPCQRVRPAVERPRPLKIASTKSAPKPREAALAARPARDSSRDSRSTLSPYQDIEQTFLDQIYVERIPEPEFWCTTTARQLQPLRR